MSHPARPKSPPPSRWRVALAEFWAGASEPSRTAAATLVASFATALAFLFWLFSPATLAGPLGAYLPQSRIDTYGYVTVDTLRLARTPQARPRLLILGTSTLVQAFGDGQDLEDMIAEETGAPWEVHVLATASQSPIEQMSILETVLANRRADDPPTVVALGVGLWRTTWTTSRTLGPEPLGRLGLRSDWADAERVRLGGRPEPRVGVYLVDNFRFVILNTQMLLRQLAIASPPERIVATYALRKPRTGRNRLVPGFTDTLDNAWSEVDDHLTQLERMVERIEGMPGVHLVLVEELLSPDVVTLFDLAERKQTLDVAIADIARRYGVPFWQLGPDAGLGPDDFNDDVHIKTGEPQRKIARQMARRWADQGPIR